MRETARTFLHSGWFWMATVVVSFVSQLHHAGVSAAGIFGYVFALLMTLGAMALLLWLIVHVRLDGEGE